MGDGVWVEVGVEKSEKVVMGVVVGLLHEWVGLGAVLVFCFCFFVVVVCWLLSVVLGAVRFCFVFVCCGLGVPMGDGSGGFAVKGGALRCRPFLRA